MIFDELSNAVFRSRLRLMGAELEGGRSNAPPPVGGGKSRGPVGRGLIKEKERRINELYPSSFSSDYWGVLSKLQCNIYVHPKVLLYLRDKQLGSSQRALTVVIIPTNVHQCAG